MHQGPRVTVGLSTECNTSHFYLMAVIYGHQFSTASRSIQQCLINLKLTNTTLCVMETWYLSCRAWWQLEQKVHFLFAPLCSLCRRAKKFSVVFQWSSQNDDERHIKSQWPHLSLKSFVSVSLLNAWLSYPCGEFPSGILYWVHFRIRLFDVLTFMF